MEKEKKKNSLVSVVMLVFGLLIATFFIISANTVSKDHENEIDIVEKSDEIKISILLKINSGSEEKKEYELNDISKQTTVFDVLENNIDIEYNNNYSYGVFIESIDGIKNGDDGKYWQYYVNDVLGDLAADKKILKDGDTVEWKFEEVQF